MTKYNFVKAISDRANELFDLIDKSEKECIRSGNTCVLTNGDGSQTPSRTIKNFKVINDKIKPEEKVHVDTSDGENRTLLYKINFEGETLLLQKHLKRNYTTISYKNMSIIEGKEQEGKNIIHVSYGKNIGAGKFASIIGRSVNSDFEEIKPSKTLSTKAKNAVEQFVENMKPEKSVV